MYWLIFNDKRADQQGDEKRRQGGERGSEGQIPKDAEGMKIRE